MTIVRIQISAAAILATLVVCGSCAAAERAPVPAAGFNIGPMALDLSDIPAEQLARVQPVVDKPTIRIRSTVETFKCEPTVYQWLLDHPDRAVRAWLKLGAKCVPIDDRGNGRFGYKDSLGSNVHWDCVVRGSTQRIWYAEGTVKPSLLLPSVPVRAVIVLHIVEGKDNKGRGAVRHQGELILSTDSKAAALITRVLGASAPRIAEQYASQIQTFFSALAWYLCEHPERMHELLGQ